MGWKFCWQLRGERLFLFELASARERDIWICSWTSILHGISIEPGGTCQMRTTVARLLHKQWRVHVPTTTALVIPGRNCRLWYAGSTSYLDSDYWESNVKYAVNLACNHLSFEWKWSYLTPSSSSNACQPLRSILLSIRRQNQPL